MEIGHANVCIHPLLGSDNVTERLYIQGIPLANVLRIAHGFSISYQKETGLGIKEYLQFFHLFLLIAFVCQKG